MGDLIRTTRTGRSFSRGCELALSGMKKRGWSQTKLAARMRKRRGCEKTTTSHTNRWLKGERKPQMYAAIAFRDLLDVPLSAWDFPARSDLKLTGTDG